MFADIAIIPITAIVIGAGFFFFIASIAGIVAEPFIKNISMN